MWGKFCGELFFADREVSVKKGNFFPRTAACQLTSGRALLIKLWSVPRKKIAWSQDTYTQVKSAIHLICQNAIVHHCKWNKTEGSASTIESDCYDNILEKCFARVQKSPLLPYMVCAARGPFLERPGKLMGQVSYFEIKVSRKLGYVLTSNQVHFVSLAENFTV